MYFGFPGRGGLRGGPLKNQSLKARGKQGWEVGASGNLVRGRKKSAVQITISCFGVGWSKVCSLMSHTS